MIRSISFTEKAAECTCGRWFDDPVAGVKHVRLARRWRFIGRLEVYGEPYYMWEHALTGRQFAWLVKRYEGDTLA